MLSHQQQGDMECLPTVVAMLAGRSKDEVIEWGLEHCLASTRPKTWCAMTRLGGWLFWETAVKVMDHFLGAGTGDAHRKASRLVDYSLGQAFVPVEGSAIPETIAPRPRKPPSGRGIITIRYGHYRQHVAAFDNGFVHDPGCDHAMTYREWRRQQGRRWKVISIQSIPEVKVR
jgi:hypothetical protein